MKLETLKQWEKEHPELAELFPILIADIDRVCKEETKKACKSIDARLQAEIGADCDKMGVSEEDKKIISEQLIGSWDVGRLVGWCATVEAAHFRPPPTPRSVLFGVGAVVFIADASGDVVELL